MTSAYEGSSPMEKVLNVGIIGAGRIGKVHAATLAYRIPSARVSAVADVNLAAAQQLAAQFGIPMATDDPAALLGNPEIDAVLICSVDRHPCPIDRGRGGRRQAHLLREAHRAGPGADRSGAGGGGEGGGEAAGRLQPPLRRQLRPRARRHRERRDRPAGAPAHRQPGSGAAAHRLRQGLRRHVPGHDDPRLRHGALPDRVRGGGGLRPGGGSP